MRPGGFTSRAEREALADEAKEEFLIKEEKNQFNFEAGRSAERRALIESSNPNRLDTPRKSRGVWAGENAIEEESEEESEHKAVQNRLWVRIVMM